MELTHFDENGNARMVDVGEKEVTKRIAVAEGKIVVCKNVYDAIKNKEIKKGDVLTVATTAGIMGVKKNFEIIPMCHILNITNAKIEWEINDTANEEGLYEIKCICTVKCEGKTGVEMEALTGVSVALLTVYDMVKAIDKTMVIKDINLIEKDGGKSGHYVKS
ncbi:MAG: cyclic pyranopterin monophosphate synthase MoaC [Lachnospiraceae bacterium]|nr:cyclic pyranopterin monophosphate synthase MoaC [Lachnospiraceae bacterium]